MNNNNINNIDLLYEDAKRLINEIVLERIDNNISKELRKLIEDFNNYWIGQDATSTINNLIELENKIIDTRDIIGNIGVDLSYIVKNIRDQENLEEIKLPPFQLLSFKHIDKLDTVFTSTTEIYMSEEINNINSILNNISINIDELNLSIETIKTSILTNILDDNKISIDNNFKKVLLNINNIETSINEINNKIINSIENYKSINNKFNNITTKPISNNIETNTYSIKEKEVLNAIKNNIETNKEINKEFTDKVYSKLKEKLSKEGIK